MPLDDRGRDLADDYRGMGEMIFGAIPSWDNILATLKSLEAEIKASRLQRVRDRHRW